ncbi:MAG: hypothetical protein ACRC37_08095 [Lentisphaeria bacterium]
MSKISVYIFKHAPEIYSDLNGKFFRIDNEKPLKIIYHSGRIAVRDNNKIYGIKKLRINAIKYQIEKPINPF